MKSMFVITMIDHYSRFAIVKPTIYAPTGREAANLLDMTLERFHVSPDSVQVDSGTQFTSSDFCRAVAELNCKLILAPVSCSWTNGRVERLHRIINDRLRSQLNQEITRDFTLFSKNITRIIREYNTAYSNILKRTPHDVIFTFESFIHPKLKQFRKQKPTNPEEIIQTTPVDISRKRERPQKEKPQVGQYWLSKKRKPRKGQERYVACQIVDKVSEQVCRIMLPNHARMLEHIRNLKPITPEAYAKLPERLQIPDERPIRNLRRGGV